MAIDAERLVADFKWFDDPVHARQTVDSIVGSWQARCNQAKQKLAAVDAEVVQKEQDDAGSVHDASHKAYASLKQVVAILLDIDNGHTRLSRQDKSILQCLDQAVEQFEALTKVAHVNFQGLGIQAGDCTEFRDRLLFIRGALDEDATQLITDATAAWREGSSRDSEHVRLVADESSCHQRLADAQSAYDTADNWFTGAFTGAGEVDARRNRRDEMRAALERNQEGQRRESTRKTDYYSLAAQIKIASAALVELSSQLQTTAAAALEAFTKIGTAQMAASRLWGGFIDLKNEIWSTDYHSTRDRSLHKVLDLLRADDEVFMLQDCIEKTEREIKQDIAARLGDANLARLLASGAESVEPSSEDLEL
ncbi:hypothetical protein DOTSEDRAFT_72476 [Dothistroma septosporum NZE10]|uniref:Uncharacterized protein n=1 Tax=Dothistroma septosporum (strain NZE10 / CBS 128990) TaxID=675120 RepID=M2YM71_DOTSN|nr:hypothetical protein DOTSEDRAFT_72476 [Dothistroma septosporum NZE10]